MTITIYADSNIYRYVATGELAITTVGPIRFAYSSVHFDEIIRSGNTEMLHGMEALKAVGVVTNESGEYNVDDIGVCLEYVDPFEKFEKYKNDVEPNQDAENSLNEMLLAFLGADNYEELRNIPQSIIDIALDATDHVRSDPESLVDRALTTAKDLEGFIEKDLSKPRPLSETRKAFGLPKGATSIYGSDKNPINGIWEHLKDKVAGISKDQFFGFEAIPGVESEQTRIGSVSACHLILNMVGLHPDKGLPNREKIANIVSDGQHTGFASLCGGLITSDCRLYRKAQAIYEYRKYSTQSMHIPYVSTGMSTTLVDLSAINTVKLERK